MSSCCNCNFFANSQCMLSENDVNCMQHIPRMLTLRRIPMPGYIPDKALTVENGVLFGLNTDGTGIAFDEPMQADLIALLVNNLMESI